ncbi:transporter substrate-binding domain-containing protein [Terasakiella sp. A23]|uniref:substrate-binding periplasmic protein n=1 Tax=Terasakiella sp. FCG-A23 TaxID=3080561 RepID=UPI0029533691|nr:transporter substrate-binding domain-containing protein [Terasakiella sp. A23]MDV7341409.1 transporter substrate-binding domain-containing protein [Terasakiella sp. A23]
MLRKIRRTVMVLMASLLTLAQAAKAETLRVSTEEWPGYTNADMTGLYFDILNMVFKPHGYALDVRIVPYTRSIHNTISGKSDLWIGAYEGDNEEAIYPKKYYDLDLVEAICVSGILTDKNPLDSLNGKKLGWIRGYEYDAYIPFDANFREFDDRAAAIDSLQRQKLDCFLDDKTINDYLLTNYPDLVKELDRRKIIFLPLFFGFSPTEKGKQLADLFDREFPKYVMSGELEALHQKWNLPFYHEQMLKRLN